MKKLYLNKLEMYRTVREILDANATSWEGIPKLVSKVSEFKDKISVLEQLSEVHGKITTGVTEARTEFKEDLVTRALKVSAALYVFANDSKNPELKDNVSITRTQISKFGKGKTIELLDRIILEANSHIDELGDFGITQDLIADLKNRREILVAMETRTRTVIIDRMNHSKSIKATIDSIDKLLKDGIDMLIKQNSEMFGELVGVYSKARSVMNYGTRHKKPGFPEYGSENVDEQ